MNFLAPGALFLGLLAIPILLLYLLRLRRPEFVVSSIFLWAQVLADREANSPWQRLRRNLLLLIQLLILSLLVLSLARPTIPTEAFSTSPIVILLDATASMNAQETEGRRFDLAVEMARDVLSNLPAERPGSLILAGPQARLLVPPTVDRERLLAGLEDLAPSHGEGDWPGALALAAGSMRAISSRATLIVISDGGIPEGEYPELPGDVRYLPVGRAGENLSIEAVSSRTTGTGVELFVRVDNHGALPQTANLAVRAGGALLSAREINLAPGESRREIFTELPSGLPTLEARLTRHIRGSDSEDALPLDDAGYLVIRDPGTSDVLLSSQGNFFLEQLLAALPGIEAFRTAPGEAAEPGRLSREFDIYIFDGNLPATLPGGNLLLIKPPDSELIPVSGVLDSGPFRGRTLDHPLTEFLDWADVTIGRALKIPAPNWMDVLVEVDGEPLVLAGERNGRRVAVVGFDLQESDLPLRLAFPVLFGSLLEYLGEGDLPVLPETLHAGTPVRVAVVPAWTFAELSTPGGQIHTWVRPMGETLAFVPEETGQYQLTIHEDGQTVISFAALNLFSEIESDIAPRDSITLGQTIPATGSGMEGGQREIWPFLAGVALLLLGAEWWIYHRGRPQRRRPDVGAPGKRLPSDPQAAVRRSG